MARCLLTFNFRQQGPHPCAHTVMLNFARIHYIPARFHWLNWILAQGVAMDARFMQMHNLVLTREVIINSMFPVDGMRKINFNRETAVQ